MIDRDKYFDAVRDSLFAGSMTQEQVDGQTIILDEWYSFADPRWIAYSLATTYHETAQTMQPIEEYGKGEGKDYGVVDPETGQVYYGRGFVQLTWKANYQRATDELGIDMVWDASNALRPFAAAQVLVTGMTEGWFTDWKLGDFFTDTKNDPYNARKIVNGLDCADLIATYHGLFLEAIEGAQVEPDAEPGFRVAIDAPAGMVSITVNGKKWGPV